LLRHKSAKAYGDISSELKMNPITVSRLLFATVMISIVTLTGCEGWRGDEEVETEPEEGSAEGPGLFTGKAGGIILEVEPWKGASPHGDTEE
jgi:hypothetical protein